MGLHPLTPYVIAGDENNIDNDHDGSTENQGDCNDEDSSIHPGATEICGDGIDQDCNGADLICSDSDNKGMTWLQLLLDD